MWRVEDIIQAVHGEAYRIERGIFNDISTDSRTIQEGELFVPINGKTFDGHEFIVDAYLRSHGGTLCEKGREDVIKAAKGTIILVDNTTKAFLDLARHMRKSLKGTFIAITGSNGKTTTKEILVAILGRSRQVHFNEKNFNNLIGVSKSILAVKGSPEMFIFELGTNSRGEIRQLTEVTEPDVSVITNINPSHLEGLADLDGVFDEKSDIFRHTKAGGHILINADDPMLFPRYQDSDHVYHTFGIDGVADFHLRIREDLGWKGYDLTLEFFKDTFNVKTRLLGRHNLYNILVASSIAYLVGISPSQIKSVIEAFNPYSMRFNPIMGKKAYTVVDDSYNANPSSVKWALNTLASLPCTGRRIAVLGDMKELGEKTAFYHEEIGRFLKESNINSVLLIGEEVKGILKELNNGQGRFFHDKASLIDYAKQYLTGGDVVLIKGSRAAKMEEIVEALI
ncbi:MAG TPA: UDP-N-acetylmuramoyl-tripeptide--D-alanyl-D-alanine ligase [Syntrophorhabdus sp.]|nr:UDP-N-acetylmuramoyl-tripeptide--D-alanyl-D-alanine ligase [Syntrophorhabdus sp.]